MATQLHSYQYECFGCGHREMREVVPKAKREQWCARCGNYMKLLPLYVPAWALAQAGGARDGRVS